MKWTLTLFESKLILWLKVSSSHETVLASCDNYPHWHVWYRGNFDREEFQCLRPIVVILCSYSTKNIMHAEAIHDISRAKKWRYIFLIQCVAVFMGKLWSSGKGRPLAFGLVGRSWYWHLRQFKWFRFRSLCHLHEWHLFHI